MVIASTSSLGQFHGSSVDPFGQTIKSSSNSSAHPLFGTSTPFGSPIGASVFGERKSSPFGSTSSHFGGSQGTTIFGGIASPTGICNQCRGSAVASYSATQEVDGINSRYSAGKIKSFSEMPIYKDKSHEELRSEDYELLKGSTFSIQNQGNAFQQSNCHFGPSTASVSSTQFSFSSGSGLAFGTANAAPVSNSSVKPPFGRTGTVFGVSPSFGSGGSIGDSNVDRAPRNSASGGTTIFGAPNNSGISFKSTPAVLHSNSAHGSTSLICGVSTMPPIAPGSASSGFRSSIFGLPSTSVSEGSSTSAFQVSTTPGFGIRSKPSLWSTSASVGSSLSGPKSTCAIGAPSTSNFSVSTTSGFRFNSTSASGNSSIFGIQSFSGSQDATTLEPTVGNQCQGSGVASYYATREVAGTNNRYSVEKIQSISAMPIYKDKSHEELRSEDYKLCKKGGHTPWGGQSLGSACFKTSDTPANIFRCPPLSSQSSFNSTFHLFKPSLSAPKSQHFITPSSTISTAPTLSPSVNPLSPTNLYPSQSKAFIPQPTVVSSMPTFTPSLNLSSLTPFSESMPANSCQCPAISTTFTSPSLCTFSSSEPSSTVSPSIQSTSATALGPWLSIMNASQPGQTAEKVDYLSINNQSQPSQTSNGLKMVTEVGIQNINGLEYVPASTVGMQSSLVMNPFAKRSAIDQPNAVSSIQYGISSLPQVSHNVSSDRRTSLLRIRHVSLRHNWLPAQRHIGSGEHKVPFFSDEEDRPGPIAPFLPRENPRAWVANSLSLRSNSDSKGCEDKACPSSSFQLNVNPTGVTDDTSAQEEDLSAILNWHQDDDAAVIGKHEADVLALMPKLPDGEYYTEPSLKELAAMEMAEPGCCSRVNEFVMGRRGYGSIKFLGETDVRNLDLESIVQFNNREVIVYVDDRKKPPVGQSLNKPAEVTLLNVKCISKKTGKQYIDGLQVQSFKEMLIKKTSEQEAEFVSYDPVQGEWKFRVQHF
ncbi:hypothetical protein Pfo_002166 [Paulownia fortunei]|nr:hypothetical protein Pfo_002166 [Paulownia fortunei]